MGGGNYSANIYSNSTQSKINAGANFGYSKQTRGQGRGAWKAHEDLNPKKVAGAGSPLAGQIVRESRDGVDHPNSVPIAIFLDVTGSNVADAARVQAKLNSLFGLLLRKGYVEDPQILIGAYGDAKTDSVPLQVSQFESDNRVDDALDKLFLEGGGGGNGGESMGIAAYYLAHHTATDALEKRNKKGYAFFVADEISHVPAAREIIDIVGDEEPYGRLELADVFKDTQEKWEVFVLINNNISAQGQGSVAFYKKYFGNDHVLVLETPESVVETIGVVIGLQEGTIDIDEAEDDLIESGSDAVAIKGAISAVKGLSGIVRPAVSGAVKVADDTGATRL